MVEEDLRRGALVEMMQDCAGRTRSFSLLYPANRHMPLRTRVFIDFLLERIAGRAGIG